MNAKLALLLILGVASVSTASADTPERRSLQTQLLIEAKNTATRLIASSAMRTEAEALAFAAKLSADSSNLMKFVVSENRIIMTPASPEHASDTVTFWLETKVASYAWRCSTSSALMLPVCNSMNGIKPFDKPTSSGDGSAVPLHARLKKVGGDKGSLDLGDMRCSRVPDDPEKLKCDFSMMSLLWSEPLEVYDQRATEADRTKSIDEATAEIQSNPQSFCGEIKEAVDEMKKPDGQRVAKFMDVETRTFFDKVLDVCETTNPGSLTARLTSLIPRTKMDAIIISMRTAQIQSENESCYYSLRSRTLTFSKRSENQWEYKKRNARDNGCDSQHHSEVVFDPERKEWTWSTEQGLAPNVDPEKNCRVFQLREKYRSTDGAPAPGCKYFSSSY